MKPPGGGDGGPAGARARARAVVRGMVQGVAFRAATRYAAQGLGVAGWVRNAPDGSVELVAEGSRDAVERLLEFVRTGPPSARVEDVDVEWEEPSGEFGGFEVRR